MLESKHLQKVQGDQGSLFLHAVQANQQYHGIQPDPEDLKALPSLRVHQQVHEVQRLPAFLGGQHHHEHPLVRLYRQDQQDQQHQDYPVVGRQRINTHHRSRSTRWSLRSRSTSLSLLSSFTKLSLGSRLTICTLDVFSRAGLRSSKASRSRRTDLTTITLQKDRRLRVLGCHQFLSLQAYPAGRGVPEVQQRQQIQVYQEVHEVPEDPEVQHHRAHQGNHAHPVRKQKGICFTLSNKPKHIRWLPLVQGIPSLQAVHGLPEDQVGRGDHPHQGHPTEGTSSTFRTTSTRNTTVTGGTLRKTRHRELQQDQQAPGDRTKNQQKCPENSPLQALVAQVVQVGQGFQGCQAHHLFHEVLPPFLPEDPKPGCPKWPLSQGFIQTSRLLSLNQSTRPGHSNLFLSPAGSQHHPTPTEPFITRRGLMWTKDNPTEVG
ncbi:hypothetical protein INR49_017137 [Caranx melampygus]|nr:hypothetical protein INR49_017137 [Caranx melampygus]